METLPRRGRARPHGHRDSRRKLVVALGLTALSVTAAALAARRRSRRPAASQGPSAPQPEAAGASSHPLVIERRASADPNALQVLVDGAPSRVGFDVERLQTLKEANYKPLMEYLQYIQVQRGGSDTLVFVRTRDLDQLAGLVGQSRDEFLKQFKKLGVLLSMN